MENEANGVECRSECNPNSREKLLTKFSTEVLIELKKNRDVLIGMDIETCANPNLFGSLPEPEVSLGNLKDPDKIREKLESAKVKQRKDMALDPLYGRVACVSFYVSDDTKWSICLTCTDKDEEEKALLHSVSVVLEKLHTALRHADGHGNITLVGHNIHAFDLYFLQRRAVILGFPMDSPIFTSNIGEWEGLIRTRDTLRAWTSWQIGDRRYVSLDALSRAILGEKQTDFDVSLIPDKIAEGKKGTEEIMNRCVNDARLVKKLAERFPLFL